MMVGRRSYISYPVRMVTFHEYTTTEKFGCKPLTAQTVSETFSRLPESKKLTHEAHQTPRLGGKAK